MADNFQVNAVSGTPGDTFAADEISAVKHPRVKVQWGPDGTATDADDATNSRLPVKVGDALPAGTNNIGDVDVLTSPGTFAEDSAHASGNTGQFILGVRNDALAGLTSTDGDYSPVSVDNTGAVRVIIQDDLSIGSGIATDDSAFTAGVSTGNPLMGFATSDAVDAGDVGVVAMTTTRAMHVTLRDSVGDSAMDDTNNAVRVNIVAGAGSGGTAATDNSVFTGGTTSVTPIGAIFDTTPPTITDGNVGAPRMNANRDLRFHAVDGAGDSITDDANNAIRVNIVAGAGSGGTAIADEAAFTEGSTSFTPVGGVLNDTIASDPTEDQGAAFRITAKRALHVNLRSNGGADLTVTDGSAAGTIGLHALGTDGTNAQIISTNTTGHVNIADGGNSITVDGSVSITGSVDTELPAAAALADNTANPTVPGVGAFLMAFDGTNWDRVQTGAAATGALKVDGSAVTQPISGTVTANAGTGTFAVGGVAAHDAAVSGNPVRIAGKANQNEPTAVADGDTTDIWTDQQGRLVVVQGFPANVASSTHGPNTTTISSTTETTVATGVASNSIHVTELSCSNTSATITRVDLRDGTAGTIRWSMALAASGGGFVQRFSPPWKLTAANNLTAQLSAAVTDVRVNVHFFIAP